MKQKQSIKNDKTKSDSVDEESIESLIENKVSSQDSKRLENYKAFFRHLLSDDIELDDELTDDLDSNDTPKSRDCIF